jgi:hypothetical protein
LPSITITRADLTSEEVTRVLRAGLGAHYHMVPGMRMPQACLFAAEPNQDPDTILVSIGSNRLSNRFFRAQVTLTRRSGQTVIRIRPGGTSSEFPITRWASPGRSARSWQAPWHPVTGLRRTGGKSSETGSGAQRRFVAFGGTTAPWPHSTVPMAAPTARP